MKNKTLFLLMIVSFLVATGAIAQQKPLELSVNIYGGYGLFSPGADRFPTVYTANYYYADKVGFENGLHAGAGLSLKINKLFSVGIDVDHLGGTKNITYSQTDTNRSTESSNHKIWSVIPNISFVLYNTRTFSLYNTLGIILAVDTKFNYAFTNDTFKPGQANNPAYHGDENVIFKYGFNTGVKDAFGTRFKLTKNLKAVAEVYAFLLPLQPKSSTLYTSVNGSYHGTFTDIYSGSGSYTQQYSRQTINNIVTETGTTYQPPFSQHVFSLGVNLGLTFSLTR